MDIDLIKNFNYQIIVTDEGHNRTMFNLMNHYKTINLFENFILTIKKPNKHVLEIGTGYGCCLAELADKYPNNHYYGITFHREPYKGYLKINPSKDYLINFLKITTTLI